jgi:hypothetical protein
VKLRYKDDWEATQKRYAAWWSGEYIGRCGLFITAPKDGIGDEPAPVMPEDPVKRWTDLEYITACNDYEHRRTFYGAEAFPIWYPGYPGHTSIPAYLGCPTVLDLTTGWWEPILTGEEWRTEDLRLDRNGRWWKFTMALLECEAKEAMGKSLPSTGAFVGCGDTLAALRGTDRLLIDVIACPDLVRRTEKVLMDIWFEVYETFRAVLRPAADGGSCGWFPLWAPGKFYAVQNDFSYMISPGMFRDLFLPEIRRQTEFLDYTVYHVDGVAAFAHVPALCELPKLQAIQILPGAGKPSPLHYADALRTVQAGGKNLHITIPPEEVEPALKMLSAKGLFIHTWCATEAETRTLIRNAERWSRPRPA